MRFVNKEVLSAADVASDQASAPIDASNLFAASIQAVLTGSPSGSLKLQASNDEPLSGVPTNWSDIGSAVSISASGVVVFPKIDVCYRYLRVLYAKTSGTGTVTARFNATGF